MMDATWSNPEPVEVDGVLYIGGRIGKRQLLPVLHPVYMVLLIRGLYEDIKGDRWQVVPGSVSHSLSAAEDAARTAIRSRVFGQVAAQALVAVTHGAMFGGTADEVAGVVLALSAAGFYPHIDGQTPILPGRDQLEAAVSEKMGMIARATMRAAEAAAAATEAAAADPANDTAVLGDSKKVTA